MYYYTKKMKERKNARAPKKDTSGTEATCVGRWKRLLADKTGMPKTEGSRRNAWLTATEAGDTIQMRSTRHSLTDSVSAVAIQLSSKMNQYHAGLQKYTGRAARVAPSDTRRPSVHSSANRFPPAGEGARLEAPPEAKYVPGTWYAFSLHFFITVGAQNCTGRGRLRPCGHRKKSRKKIKKTERNVWR